MLAKRPGMDGLRFSQCLDPGIVYSQVIWLMNGAEIAQFIAVTFDTAPFPAILAAG